MAKKMSLSPLAASVKQDIQAFLSGLTRPFTCEADFQHELVNYLRNTSNYQKIHLEYLVPYVTIAGITSNARVDIVVEHNGEFVPIELKFKTKSLSAPKTPYSCFGFPTNLPLIKDMAAQNDNRYAVWKDVKRIEWIKSCCSYSNQHGQVWINGGKEFSEDTEAVSNTRPVLNGFVVFISNDPAYQNPAKGYSTANCSHSKPIEYHSRKPALGISGGYDIDWRPIPGITIGGTQPFPPFAYIIIEV